MTFEQHDMTIVSTSPVRLATVSTLFRTGEDYDNKSSESTTRQKMMGLAFYNPPSQDDCSSFPPPTSNSADHWPSGNVL